MKAKGLLFSLTVFLLFLEIVLRIWGPRYHFVNPSYTEYYSNPRGYFVPVRKEGQRTVFSVPCAEDNNKFRIHGIRKSGKGQAILGLGDSFTYGQGVWHEDLYLTRLESLLRESGFAAVVENRAVSASNLEDVLKIYEDIPDKKRFPIVIYGFVLNDFDPPLDFDRLGITDFINEINGVGREARFLRKYSAVIDSTFFLIDRHRIHGKTIMSYLDAYRGDSAGKYFALLRELNSKVKINQGKLAVVIFPLLYKFDEYPFAEIHVRLKSFFESEGIAYLDLLPAFSKFRDSDLWVHPLDHHPNEKAHAIAAGEIGNFLLGRNLLDKKTMKAFQQQEGK